MASLTYTQIATFTDVIGVTYEKTRMKTIASWLKTPRLDEDILAKKIRLPRYFELETVEKLIQIRESLGYLIVKFDRIDRCNIKQFRTQMANFGVNVAARTDADLRLIQLIA